MLPGIENNSGIIGKKLPTGRFARAAAVDVARVHVFLLRTKWQRRVLVGPASKRPKERAATRPTIQAARELLVWFHFSID